MFWLSRAGMLSSFKSEATVSGKCPGRWWLPGCSCAAAGCRADQCGQVQPEEETHTVLSLIHYRWLVRTVDGQGRLGLACPLASATGRRDAPMKGLNGMPDAKELLHSNLHEVFSERDTERRRVAVERTYSEDVVFIDPEGEFAGRHALSDQAQKVLDGAPAGFVFEEDGPQYVGTDTAALPWRFGSPGSPAVRGIDILTIREGRVSVVHTLTVPETNA